MLRYDFDILRPSGHGRFRGAAAVHFRDRSTARAFKVAPWPIREWLLKAGFRDGVSGSVRVPGRYAPEDEGARAQVLEHLEAGIASLPPATEFDPAEFVAQALRARPDTQAQQLVREVALAPWWTTRRAAG